jgi:hypothetical protein
MNLGLEILTGSDASLVYSMMKDRYQEKGMNVAIAGSQYLQDLLECYPEELKCYLVQTKEGGKTVQSYLIHNYKRCILWIGGMSTGKRAVFVITYIGNIQRVKAAGYKEIEYLGANVRNLCQNRRLYNPTLEMSFSLCKKDIYGKLGEWTYKNFFKKKWL